MTVQVLEETRGRPNTAAFVAQAAGEDSLVAIRSSIRSRTLAKNADGTVLRSVTMLGVEDRVLFGWRQALQLLGRPDLRRHPTERTGATRNDRDEPPLR